MAKYLLVSYMTKKLKAFMLPTKFRPNSSQGILCIVSQTTTNNAIKYEVVHGFVA